MSLDAKVPIQDRKHAAGACVQYSIFLLRAMSLMIKYCSITGASVSKSDNTLYTMEKAEIELLVHEVANRNWWRSNILDLPVARNAISRIWATLCQNDNQQSQIYLKQIFHQISESSF